LQSKLIIICPYPRLNVYLILTTEDIKMLSINNNNIYDHLVRERQVIELYNQGKSTRDIAKELRMSLRDISVILRNNQVSHGIVITDNSNDNANNKAPSRVLQP
jgi:DNA-binding CsgD family transcriptional regulator